MKLIFSNFRNLRLAVSMTLGLCLGNAGWSAPSIQSIDVSPNPFVTGQNFTLAVTASADVTEAIAMVDFRPGDFRVLEIPLVKEGAIWTGTGVVPPELQVSTPAGAIVRVTTINADRQRFEAVLRVGVNINPVSAVLANGVLTITGDDQDNTLAVSRDAAGTLLVLANSSPLAIAGGRATVANTSLIRLAGLEGNDTLLINEANGALPAANLLGGEGEDFLSSGSNVDELDGGPGSDTLRAGGGNDRLFGGPGDDTLIGGTGVDQFFGGEGDDLIIWNPGDASDLVEGEAGQDTMLFAGANVSEIVDISAVGQRLRFFRNPAAIVMDCDGIEKVDFRAAAGNDAVTINDLTGTQVTHVSIDLISTATNQTNAVVINATATNDQITVTTSTNGMDIVGLSAAVTVIGGQQDIDELVINALSGTDTVDASDVEAGAIDLTLNGGAGNDLLIGGAGNDLINGGQGADVMRGGAGDDTFPWFPGDASDVVEGEAGQDAMRFIGAGGDEAVDISANGQRLRFFRAPGAITMDCNETELIQFEALGGADTITVNDLAGTGVNRVNLDLAIPQGSGVGDNGADTIVINGTTNNDVVTITGSTAGVEVLGLSAIVSIVGSELTLDQLVLQLLTGDDIADASNLQAGIIKLILGGGLGGDVLIGGAGDDTLFGDEGDDVLNGGPGLDALDGGPGDNVVLQD
jgi:Ca2+-binding RTX toxin-like protein